MTAWFKLPPTLLSILSYPKHHPVIFGLGFSCLKTSFADFLVQRYVEGRKKIDLHRNLAFGAFGLFYLGGVQYFLYVPVFRRLFPYALTWAEKPFLSKIKDRKGMVTMMKQVFIDQCVHHPLAYFPCFYVTKSLVTGGTVQNAVDNYKKNIFGDMWALWKVWVPATIINFTVSPFWLRIPFVACTSLFWTCILSAKRGATEVNPQESLDVIGNVGTALIHRLYHHDNPDNTHYVLTATGQDRVGLVSDLAEIISKNGGNIFESRMSRLGGDFTIIMLVGVDRAHTLQLTGALTTLTDLHILTRETHLGTPPETHLPSSDGSFSFHGPDQPGLVYKIMQCFKKHHLNIRTLITESNPNMEGDKPYFGMRGTFSVPKDVHVEQLEEDLENLRGQLSPSSLDFKLSLEGKEECKIK